MRTLLAAEQLDAGIGRPAAAGRAEVALDRDSVGFDIPDEFVVGYGLGLDGGFRHLPSLAAPDHADIETLRTAFLHGVS